MLLLVRPFLWASAWVFGALCSAHHGTSKREKTMKEKGTNKRGRGRPRHEIKQVTLSLRLDVDLYGYLKCSLQGKSINQYINDLIRYNAGLWVVFAWQSVKLYYKQLLTHYINTPAQRSVGSRFGRTRALSKAQAAFCLAHMRAAFIVFSCIFRPQKLQLCK